MRSLGVCSWCACALLAACASNASAQLVFGSTTTDGNNPCGMYYDVGSGQVTTLWKSAANKKVNGLAADAVNQKLYANDAARLNVWNYGSVGTAPTAIAGMYRTSDPNTFTATGVDGLAFANGQLYGSTSYPSTVYKRGIYQIATVAVNSRCVMTQIWTDPTSSGTYSGALTFGGLEFNPADNLFYATLSAIDPNYANPPPRGLYSIDAFGAGAMTKVADLPAGRTKIDGLAIGGGKYWMTEQEPNAAENDIYPYDPVSGTYGTTIYVPLTDATQRATGAAWAPGAIPEPGTFGALVLLALASLRRRR